MVTIEAVELGNQVMCSTLDKLENVMKYQRNAHLTHGQRNGLDDYAIFLIECLVGIAERNHGRLKAIERADKEQHKRSVKEELPF